MRRLLQILRVPPLAVRPLYRPPLEAPRPALSTLGDLLGYAKRWLGLRPRAVYCVGSADAFRDVERCFPEASLVHVATTEDVPDLKADEVNMAGDVLLVRTGALDPDTLDRGPWPGVMDRCELVAWEVSIHQLADDVGYLDRCARLLGERGFSLLEVIGGRAETLWQPDGRFGQLDIIFARQNGRFQPWS